MHRCALIGSLAALLTGLACDGGDSAGSSRRVTLTAVNFTGGAGELDWVAVQTGGDGQSGWRPLTGTGGRYELPVEGDRFGIAFHCRFSAFAEVIFATLAELDAIAVPCAPLAGGPLHHVRGRFTDADSASATVAFARAFDGYVAQLAGASYTVDLPAGTYDLGSHRRGAPAKAIVQRDVLIDRPTEIHLDFSKGITLGTLEVSLTGLDRQEAPLVRTTLNTRSGRSIQLAADEGRPYRFAARDLEPGETQDIVVAATAPTGSVRGITRTLPLADVEALPLALPAPLGPVQMSTADSRPQVTFTPVPAATFYQLTMIPLVAAGDPTSWILNVGAGWLGSGGSFALPDLSAVPGFDPQWGPTRDAQLIAFTAVTSTRGFGPTLNGGVTPAPGSEVTYAKQVTTLAARP